MLPCSQALTQLQGLQAKLEQMTILHHVMHNNYTGADSRTLEDTALCSSDALFHAVYISTA